MNSYDQIDLYINTISEKKDYFSIKTSRISYCLKKIFMPHMKLILYEKRETLLLKLNEHTVFG